mgnify:CR=1 FL=1
MGLQLCFLTSLLGQGALLLGQRRVREEPRGVDDARDGAELR